METYQYEKPKTFKQKWDNYWYHYKFHTFIGAVIVITLLIGIISCLQRDYGDFRILASTSKYLEDDVQRKIEDICANYVEDYDNDGEIEVIMLYTLMKDNGSIPTNFSVGQYQKFTLQVIDGNNMLILGDEKVMQSLYKANILTDIDESAEDDFSKKCISLKGNALFKETAKSTDELYFAVRKYKGTIVDGQKGAEFSYNTAMKIIEEVLKNK